jgi:integrase
MRDDWESVFLRLAGAIIFADYTYEFRPAWHRTLKDAGIKGLRFHDLRHEAVSRLVEAGLSDQEVAAISGHKSMQMLKRYTHLRAEDLVERLDQVMG